MKEIMLLLLVIDKDNSYQNINAKLILFVLNIKLKIIYKNIYFYIIIFIILGSYRAN